jgi:putative chitinase
MADGVRLSLETMRAVFPNAPDTIISAFVEKQGVLSVVGLNQTRQRLAYCFANLHAETSGFTIKNLTEDIRYSAARMAEVWDNRFANAAAVQAKYGTAPGWQLKAFDDIYGNRIGVDLVSAPDLASNHALQPDIAAAFWDWKGMNRYADASNFIGCVKAWNGGTNGLTERQSQLARIQRVLQGAEWGAVADAPVSKPDSPRATADPPSTIPAQTVQPPSAWAAFFMALAKLFGRK